QRATAGPGGCRTGPGQRAGPAGPGRPSGLDPLAGTAAMTIWSSSMRSLGMMVLLAGLSGCAGMASQPGNDSELADVRAKIALGRCDEGLVTGLRNQNMPELDQEAAYVCLQRGELEAVEQLLADYSKRHRDPPHP